VRQRPGEPLCKFIQRFSQVRHKIPKVSNAAVISAFTSGVTDVKMCEKLSVRDELDSAAELVVLADRCAKAEEGCLFLHNDADAEPDAAKPKGKDTKRKGPAVLSAEPDYKRCYDRGEAKKDNRPFCTYHNTNSHSTEDCHELKLLREGRTEHRGSRKECGRGHGGGSRGGCWGDNNNNKGASDNNRQGWQNQPRQADPQVNAAPMRANDSPPAENAGGYKEPRWVACILGRAQAPPSNRYFKQFSREVNAALPALESFSRLKWSEFPIAFDASDHPKSTKAVGAVPLLCTPTISNIAVIETLLDGGAGLNMISIETF
jgi:hypothetical protein